MKLWKRVSNDRRRMIHRKRKMPRKKFLFRSGAIIESFERSERDRTLNKRERGGRVDIETVENRGNTDGLTDRHALRYFALVANQLLYGFASRKKSTIHA